MDVNLLSLAQQALGGDLSKLAGQFLGESPGATQSAISALLPAVLGVVANKGATTQGASGLMSLIDGAKLDPSMLGNLGALFGGGGTGVNKLLEVGGGLVASLFGDKTSALTNALSSSSGVNTASAGKLLMMVVPMVLTLLKKLIGERGLNAGSLSSLLASQGPKLQGALDTRLTSALGFASPAAFLGGLGSQAADTAQRAGAAVVSGAGAAATTARSGMMRWLPWIIGAAVLLFLWNMWSNRSTSTPPPAATASTPAPAAAPAAAVALPAKVYFEVGADAIGADGGSTIGAVADMAKKDGIKLSLTGYTDKTGDPAQNEELSKRRASAVRDALTAAGVAEADIEMKPPMFVEVGAAGGDAEGRRVDIDKQ